MKPKLGTRVRQAFNTLAGVTKNTLSLRSARQFLRYGNGKTTMPNWSQVVMTKQDTYTGIMFGAINIRAVTVASLANYNLQTHAKPNVMENAKKKREVVTHPYLEVIDTSKTFSNYQFWYQNSTYIDLEGLSYILVIRNVTESGLVGKVQEFKLLNPFNVQRNFDQSTGELLGYTEYKGSMKRDIPKEMIIPIINLNPFDEQPFSMSDAAKEHQFTLKTAGDYTRASITNNINAPGIIATDRELEGEELANFKARILSHEKGEPIFGGGAGSITWNDMQADLNKAALKDVNNISLQNIVAVTGASKTMLGWEESGTTRETAIVQKDNFVELRAMPQLQVIVDALNQDYKNYYPREYEQNGFKIIIDNPLGSDLDEEAKDIENRKANLDLYTTLIGQGYDKETAARFAQGETTLEDLGEPKKIEPPKETPPKEEPKENAHNHDDHYLQQVSDGLLSSTQASLQNTITNIDNRLLATVAGKVQVKNEFESEDELIEKRDRNTLQNELEIALAAFYGIILPLQARNVLTERFETFGKNTTFKMNNEVRAFIKTVAKKASTSHIDTLLKSMMKQAQADALKGLSRDQVANNLMNKFGGEIANSRAALIAQTETNRAFTMSQYQADKQFLKQNGLEGQAYKKWVTRSGNPCSFCQAMAAEPPIPFDEPFASIGDELSSTEEVDGKTVVRKMTLGFLDAEAGNLHPRCQCAYELIIQ